MKEQGYTASEERPVKVEWVMPESGDIVPAPQIQQQKPTILFRNPQQNRALWVGPEFTSFHALGLQQYISWRAFWNEFVKPTRAICDSHLPRPHVTGAGMIYVNEFILNPEQQLADFLTTGLRADSFGAGPELETVTRHLFRPEPHLELRIQTQMQTDVSNGTKKVRLEFHSTARQLLGTTPASADTLAQQAHECAKLAFEKMATEKFIETIR
jgi:uncharacterized protein (TIGR04255 family)